MPGQTSSVLVISIFAMLTTPEAYSATYHPIRNIPASRAGRFSAVVLRAAEERLISWQTASEYFCCDEQQLHTAADAIHDLFPFVFGNQHS